MNSVAELVCLFHFEDLCSIVKHLLRGVNSDDSVTSELISESWEVSTGAFHKKHDIFSILLDRGRDIAELDRFEEAFSSSSLFSVALQRDARFGEWALVLEFSEGLNRDFIVWLVQLNSQSVDL